MHEGSSHFFSLFFFAFMSFSFFCRSGQLRKFKSLLSVAWNIINLPSPHNPDLSRSGWFSRLRFRRATSIPHIGNPV